ncbi:MAG TPA: glucoamylase family protein [Saprospiraceae bacterium]|nr:glucoamylase family protein [Saprospiraceae bacterium]
MFRIIWNILLIAIISGCSQNQKISQINYSRADLKKRTFNFFWELADTNNYQILDRYPTKTFSSIAATGFGLSAYITGIENKYITRDQGAERVLKTLQTLWALPQGPDEKGVSGHKGFFYHFLNLDDAKRYKNVELSSIDTGLLMAGVLSCMSYFDNENNKTESQIRNLADSLFLRVDWNWMMKSNGKMSMGWHPEKGFIDSDWKGYNEAMILIIMAMGSPTHPIPNNAWQKWCETYPIDTFYGQKNLQFDPLFGHQYSHIWIDFRDIKDSFMMANNDDYFNNSRKATLSNKAYCVANPAQFTGYNDNCWGLTACDGPINKTLSIDGRERKFFDYRARGASSIQIIDDGTIAPTAAGGSFTFTPSESEACLAFMWDTYYNDLVGDYGFKDAFNLTYKDDKHPNGWFDIDYLGIDQGPILLQIQNHETELLWNTMKKNPYIINGLKKAGFSGGWLDKIN